MSLIKSKKQKNTVLRFLCVLLFHKILKQISKHFQKKKYSLLQNYKAQKTQQTNETHLYYKKTL